MSKVTKVTSDELHFDDGYKLYSDHSQDCCESHFLDFSNLDLKDFEDLEFNLNGDDFFEKVEGYGIKLLPTNGHPIRIPGYGFNNGYYGTNIDLILTKPGEERVFDVTECQVIKD